MDELAVNLLKAMLGQVAENRWTDMEFKIKFKGKREEDGVQMLDLQLIHNGFDMIKQQVVEEPTKGPNLVDNLHHLQGKDV